MHWGVYGHWCCLHASLYGKVIIVYGYEQQQQSPEQDNKLTAVYSSKKTIPTWAVWVQGGLAVNAVGSLQTELHNTGTVLA